VYRDSLWTYGGRKVPNDGFQADEISAATSGSRTSHTAPAEEEEEDDDDDEDKEEGSRGMGERRSGERRSGEARMSGPDEGVDEMPPDALMEYCFFAAFKTTCTDSELPLTADKFYTSHMQPARPAGQPTLDAKKTSFKQVGKFIKHMHKQKFCNVRDVKGNITILSVDRSSAAYTSFELQGTSAAKAKEEESAASGGGGGAKEEEVVALRTKPPVVTDMWQPNSYTKPLFEAVGKKDKNATYTLEDAHAVLEEYIRTRLDIGAGSADTKAAEEPVGIVATDAEQSAEVTGVLRYAGLSAAAAASAAVAFAAQGFDSLAALKAEELSLSKLTELGLSEADAELLAKVLGGEPSVGVRRWLVTSAHLEDKAAEHLATQFSAQGFDSLAALGTGLLTVAELQAFGVDEDVANSIAAGLRALKVTESAQGAGNALPAAPPPAPVASDSATLGLKDIDPEAVPLDELLLNGLVKLAGGAKKGATFATHLPLADLKAALKERMTAFHRVEVEGEAPSIRKGALKLICIEMKRAAGHNKTHVSGLESFCISPEAVSNALKVKLGCTTAVLKLPGNNVKDVEVLLQGHCVNEVCDYLRDVYCIDKQWIELKLKESKRSNT